MAVVGELVEEAFAEAQRAFAAAPQVPRRTRYQRRNRAFVAVVRARTVCERCGDAPIEWHNPEHEQSPERRLSRMVSQTVSLDRIAAEIAECQALCRMCHMTIDGRLQALSVRPLCMKNRIPPDVGGNQPTVRRSVHMTAMAQAMLNETHDRARAARTAAAAARERERVETIAFMEEALHHHWSWERIGKGIGVSATAARNYYNRNRYSVKAVRPTIGG